MLGPCEVLKTVESKQLWDFNIFSFFFFLEPEMTWHLKEIDEYNIQCVDIYFHLSSFGCSA